MFTYALGHFSQQGTVFDFHALYYDDITYEMMGIKLGAGILEALHGNAIYVKDMDGTYQQFPANSAVWEGARVTLSGGAGSPVTAAYADNGSGVLLDDIPRLKVVPTMSHITHYSNNQAQLGINNWIHTDVTVTRTIPGLTGEANTGCTITDANTSVSGYLMGGSSVPATTDFNVGVYYVKKDTDQSRMVGLLHTYLWGTSTLLIHLNTATGETAIRTNNGTTNTYMVVDDGQCWKVLIRVPNENTQSSNALRVFPSHSTSVGGTPDVTLTGSVDILQMEMHLNTTLERVSTLPPQFTTTNAANTDGTVYTMSSSNHNSGSASYYFESDIGFNGPYDSLMSDVGIVNFGVTGSYYAFDPVTGKFKVNDLTTSLPSAAVMPEDMVQCGGVYSDGEALMTLMLDGVWTSDTAFDDAMDSTGKMQLGVGTDFAFGIRNLQRFVTWSIAEGKEIIDDITGGGGGPTPIYPQLLSVETLQDTPNVTKLTFDVPVTTSGEIAAGMTLTDEDVSADIPIAVGRFGDATTEILLYTEDVIQRDVNLTFDYDAGTGAIISSASADPLQSIASMSVVNNAYTEEYMLTHIKGYVQTPDPGVPEYNFGAPRIQYGEGGQGGGDITQWYKHQIHAAQAVSIASLHNIYAAAQAENPPVDVVFHQMYTPVHVFAFDYTDGQGDYGGTQGHNMPSKDRGESTRWSFRYGTPGANTGFNRHPTDPDVFDPDGKTAYPLDSAFFPGHYVFRVGSVTPTYIPATGEVWANVDNASKYTAGQYCVVKPSLGNTTADWYHASYRMIREVDNAGDRIRIGKPDGRTSSGTVERISHYTTYDYPATGDVYIAQVSTYNGNAHHWAWNMSTACPEDSGISDGGDGGLVVNRPGKKLWELAADFFKYNANFNHKGVYYEVPFEGVLHDVDREYEFTDNANRDYNNDGIADAGCSNTGLNWNGDGYSAYYARLKVDFPTWYICGGDRWAFDSANDQETLHGTQEEALVAGFSNSPEGADGDFEKGTGFFSSYNLRCHIGRMPTIENTLHKIGNSIFATNNFSGRPPSDYRLSMGCILMNDGYTHHQKKNYSFDTWYDEYAVNVDSNSPNYGEALDHLTEDYQTMIANRGWLGQRLGSFYRVYDNTMAPGNALYSNNFESDMSGWSAKSGTVVGRDSTTSMNGSTSLKITDNKYGTTGWSFNSTSYGAALASISTASGVNHCLTFAAKSTHARHIVIQFGWKQTTLLIDSVWRRYAINFVAPSNSTQIDFNTSRWFGNVWLDDVKVHEHPADLLRCDYDNGVVLVNMSDVSQTFPLECNYLKIKGTTAQDPAHNDGELITTGNISLNKWDSIILVRTNQ